MLIPVAIDTETFLIGPGAIIPQLVCVSIATEGKHLLFAHCDAGLEDILREYFSPGTYRPIFHNAAFDVPVLIKEFPSLEALIWEKLERGECSDTMLREQLLNLSTKGKLEVMEMPDGTKIRLQYSLAALTKKYTGVDISAGKSGDDAWRMNYDKLHGLPAIKYPLAAREYAMEDAAFTLQVFEGQEERVESKSGYASLSTETFQTAVSVALAYITENGMATDEAEFIKLNQWLEHELSSDRLAPLVEAGIMVPAVPAIPHKRMDGAARELVAEWLGILPEDVEWERLDDDLRQALLDSGVKFKAAKNSSVKKAVLIDHVEKVLKQHGIPVKKTESGMTSTAAEVMQEVAPLDPVLGVYQHRQKLQKLVTTEIPRMMWDGELSPVVHFPYRTILETSRTSSFASSLFPSANGQNVDPRARPIFRARDGHVLISCDYAMLELVCVAQTTYDLFGRSVHRDKINAGYDLHAYLGSVLAYNLDAEFQEHCQEAGNTDFDSIYLYFKSRKGTPLFKKFRKLAKPVGLGFPSGLGAYKMVGLAYKDPYNIDFKELAEDRFQRHPEEFNITRVQYYAKKLQMTSGWTPMLKAIAFAQNLRSIWMETYPEMVRYFEWVKEQRDERTPYIRMGDDDEVQGLCYTTPMGMYRAACTYTAVSNGRCMQSPGAEGFKTAVFNLVRETKLGNLQDCRVVNEIHDELIVEVPEWAMHDRAMQIARIMEEAMGVVIQDVKVKAEPAAMRNWDKFAEPVFDRDNKLICWEDRLDKAA